MQMFRATLVWHSPPFSDKPERLDSDQTTVTPFQRIELRVPATKVYL